jgi:DNA primase
MDEIRSRLMLSTIIGKKVRLTRAGREFKACCPFHGEKSPSFYVNDDKQFYHCFGCGAHGDVIEFTMRHDNLSFIDAIEALAAEAGLQMPRFDPKDVEKAEERKTLHGLLDDAAKFFEEQLHKNDEILKYLRERGLTKETIQRFRIGFAPSDGAALRKHLQLKKYTDAQMIETGVLRPSTKGKEPYGFFRDRVMFPVSDRRGRVIAFSGRILPDHLRPPDREGYKPGKYINSPEGPLFDKGRTLYAENIARAAARDGKPVILAEGQMDVIACAQAGFNGVVAPMGTALTEDQILSLWSMIVSDEKVPILCFDGDNAGRTAAGRASERILPLLKPDHSVRFAFMPDGQDPDSLIKASGAAAFQKILDASISLFDFLWMSVTQGRDFSVPETRAGVVATLGEEIKKIADREVQKHYQALVQEKISETFFKRREQPGHYGRFQKGQKPGQKSGQGMPAIPALRPRTPVFRDIHARILLAALINHPHIFGEVEEAFGSFDLPDGGLSRLRNALNSALSGDSGLDREGLKAHLRDAGMEKEVDDILSESLYVHAGFAAPAADPTTVSARWLEWWHDMKGKALDAETKAGWSAALDTGSADEEEKLRNIYHMRKKGSV